MSKKHQIAIHILFWFGWILFFNKIINFSIIGTVIDTIYKGSLDNNNSEFVLNLGNISALSLIKFGVFFKASLFYIVLLFLYPKLFLKKKVLFFFISFISLGLFFFLEYIFDTFYIINLREQYGSFYLNFWKNYNIIQYVLIAIILLVYITVKELMISDKSLLIIKNEKSQSELILLKYQINPHLLFNTLNNLFSMSQKSGSEDVSKGIYELSELMRYLLYENKKEEISLNKEIEFIKNFISLQKLRDTDENNIIVNYTEIGNINSLKISPFILLPFVENAFKHGINIRKKSIININLIVQQNKLVFNVSNTIFRNYKSISHQEGGIGLNNLKKRLTLLYPDSYELKTEEIDGIFNAALIIKF